MYILEIIQVLLYHITDYVVSVESGPILKYFLFRNMLGRPARNYKRFKLATRY